MNQVRTTVCPHLGLAGDRSAVSAGPSDQHRCYVDLAGRAPDADHQIAFCLAAYHDCPFYPLPEHDERSTPRRGYLPWLAVGAVILLIAGAWASGLFGRPGRSSAGLPTPPAAQAAAQAGAVADAPTPSPVPAATHTPQPSTSADTGQNGQLLVLKPGKEDAAWWTSRPEKVKGVEQVNHLGDSFLYAGYTGGQVLVSALRLDLTDVPRGTPLEEGSSLWLTGLDAARFDPALEGSWSVQLLTADAVPDFARANFDTLFNAPSGITLNPTLRAADLGRDKVNNFALGENARQWLSDQVARGMPYVVVRIVGPVGGENTVFAWDSGTGPVTAGAAPQLRLVLGVTPEVQPTAARVVGTLQPTPENVLTAAALIDRATTVAQTTGTYTPMPANLVTPTDLPPLMATSAARPYRGTIVPLVFDTPKPGNKRTAEAQQAYATAVAVTTGTFTPVPANAVTPIIMLPTPEPENAMTAMVQGIAATALAERDGTPTPLPFNAMVATTTPQAFVATYTPVPANAATQVALARMATAVAYTTGTFTPLPQLRTPTPYDTNTPLPLLMAVTRMPTPTPTPKVRGPVPEALKGKILFFTDRISNPSLAQNSDGTITGNPDLFALDPQTGELTWVTEKWPHVTAMANEGKAPDGKHVAKVQIVTSAGWDVEHKVFTNVVDTAQVFVKDEEYNQTSQVTHTSKWSYDPAWSPQGDRVAFVSAEPGNDEIFAMKPDGSDMQRLTTNAWEWDKHPSWSPDGKQIVFWSNRETGRRQLWIMNADGSDQRRLMETPYNDWDPVWVK